MDTVANGTQLVAYTGVDSAENAAAPANAGTTGDGASVNQASTVVGAPALAQTPFTLPVSKSGAQGSARAGLLLVNNSANAAQVIRYTGLGVDAFEGCTALLPGAGVAAAGAVVTQATLEASVDALLTSLAATL